MGGCRWYVWYGSQHQCGILVVVYISYQRTFKRHLRKDPTKHLESDQAIYRALLVTIGPIVLSTLVYNIGTLIDQGIFNSVLASQGYSEKQYSTIWGIYSGKYRVLMNVPLCVASCLSPSVVPALTAAMADGTGLARFKKHYPNRFFDVGIAEEHGVTFAAGLAAGGLKPVFAVYSSFLQRGYDQLIHDVALQNLPVVFGVDRAGLVGSDGETHQGIFDLSFLSNIPNMTVMSPKNKWELADMLRFALQMNSPVAIRYPRGKAYDGYEGCRERISYGKSEWIFEGKEIAILSVGHMFEEAVKTRDKLIEQGYEPTLINMRFIKPIDEAMIEKVCQTHKLIAVIEENVQTGACGERVSEYVMRKMLPSHVLTLALPDDYIEHGSVDVLRKMTGIDSESMSEKIIETYKEL